MSLHNSSLQSLQVRVSSSPRLTRCSLHLRPMDIVGSPPACSSESENRQVRLDSVLRRFRAETAASSGNRRAHRNGQHSHPHPLPGERHTPCQTTCPSKRPTYIRRPSPGYPPDLPNAAYRSATAAAPGTDRRLVLPAPVASVPVRARCTIVSHHLVPSARSARGYRETPPGLHSLRFVARHPQGLQPSSSETLATCSLRSSSNIHSARSPATEAPLVLRCVRGDGNGCVEQKRHSLLHSDRRNRLLSARRSASVPRAS